MSIKRLAMVIRTRILKLFATAAAAACLVGLVMVAPAVAPTASADTLPNGLIVDCTNDSEIHVTCVVSGCPRVRGDYVPDELHYKRWYQVEVGFECSEGETARVGFDHDNKPFDFGVQVCRKQIVYNDLCGPWSTYHYTPPAAPAPAAPAPDQCPAGSQTPTVPAGAQCAPPPQQGW
jgi:hypothetical protein